MINASGESHTASRLSLAVLRALFLISVVS